MAVQADDILTLAGNQVGTRESPAGSNNVKYNTEYYGRVINDPEYAWCAVFIWWLFKTLGFEEAVLRDGVKTASCPYLVGTFKAKGQWVTGPYRRGDVVFFRWGSSGYDHVGIIEAVSDDGTLTTIEGNTSVTSDDNGGAVMRRIRTLSYVVGAGRPDYAGEKGAADAPTAEAPPAESDTAFAGTYLVTARSGLNVRSGPGTEYARLGALACSTLIPVTGKTGDWYEVSYNGKTGYCSAEYLTSVETSPEAAPTAGIGAGDYRVTAQSGLNVRSGPGTDYSKLGAFGYGEAVPVTGKTGDWYEVSCNGKTGYCSAEYLAPVEANPEVNPAADTGAGEYRVTAQSGLNVRSGPGTDYERLGAMAYNTAVQVTGKTDGWYKVEYDGKTGYCSAEYLERV